MKKGISVHCHITGRHSSRSTFESGGGGGGGGWLSFGMDHRGVREEVKEKKTKQAR